MENALYRIVSYFQVFCRNTIIFEKFFGKGAFNDALDLTALEADLDDRIVQVREMATTPQLMQVLRDLCLVARAEDHISELETDALNRIATGLGVAREFVCQSLDSSLEPD